MLYASGYVRLTCMLFSKTAAVCQNDLSVGMLYPEILLACANASLTLALNRECFSTSVFGAITLL